jgi:hypothetical protein
MAWAYTAAMNKQITYKWQSTQNGAALLKNKSSNDALALKARKRNITYTLDNIIP